MLCFHVLYVMLIASGMASSGPANELSCSMFGCPHTGTPLGQVAQHSLCSPGCSYRMCGGCCTDVVKATGALRCSGCRGYFSTFSTTTPQTVTEVLRKQHADTRKRSRAAADDSDEWVIDSIIGVHHFAGDVYYKVAYELDRRQKSAVWLNMESQAQWETREHLLDEGCQLLLSEFHDRFMVPMPVPTEYRWEFCSPSLRFNPRTKAREFRCATGQCRKEFGSKDAANKHSYSMAHLATNEEISLPYGVKSPFMCLLCSKVCAFSQMSSLTAHRVQVHTVKDFDTAAWVERAEELREEAASMMD